MRRCRGSIFDWHMACTRSAWLAIETVIERLARHLGRDIDAVRSQNYYCVDDRNTTPYGQQVEDNVIRQMVDRLARQADIDTRQDAVAAFNRDNDVLK